MSHYFVGIQFFKIEGLVLQAFHTQILDLPPIKVTGKTDIDLTRAGLRPESPVEINGSSGHGRPERRVVEIHHLSLLIKILLCGLDTNI